MKIILAIVTIFSIMPSVSFAGRYAAVGKDLPLSKYTHKDHCEQIEGQACYYIVGKDLRYHTAQDVSVDDTSKPIYKPRYNINACTSTDQCLELYLSKQSEKQDEGCVENQETSEVECPLVEQCTAGDKLYWGENKSLPGYSVYCSRLLGYEQKVEKQVKEDLSLKANVETKDASMAVELATKAKIARNMKFANTMIVEISYIMATKNLNATQIIALENKFEEVKRVAKSGSIETAKGLLGALTVDTVFVQADKDLLLSKINAYLGQ